MAERGFRDMVPTEWEGDAADTNPRISGSYRAPSQPSSCAIRRSGHLDAFSPRFTTAGLQALLVLCLLYYLLAWMEIILQTIYNLACVKDVPGLDQYS